MLLSAGLKLKRFHVKGKTSLVLSAVSDPDEAYLDATLAVHVLKRLGLGLG